jgi:hypothetical protein
MDLELLVAKGYSQRNMPHSHQGLFGLLCNRPRAFLLKWHLPNKFWEHFFILAICAFCWYNSLPHSQQLRNGKKNDKR